jgi:TetR/AcrR family transcriptional regulator, cholesterol catabolism regulator
LTVVENERLAAEDMSPSQRQRRAIVIDVTLKMIAESGSGVEIRDICQRSGVALGTVYKYFGSKDSLFAEAYLKWRTEHLQDITNAASGRRSNSSRMRAALRKAVDLFLEGPQYLELSALMRSSRQPEIIQQRRDLEQETASLFKGLLSDMSSKDADGIVFVLMASFSLAMTQYGAQDRTREGVYDAIDEAVRVSLDRSAA